MPNGVEQLDALQLDLVDPDEAALDAILDVVADFLLDAVGTSNITTEAT